MTDRQKRPDARVGDWLEEQGIHGHPPRRGEIREVLGRPGHEHYRVRWDEEHESLVYPDDGVSIVRHTPRPAQD